MKYYRLVLVVCVLCMGFSGLTHAEASSADLVRVGAELRLRNETLVNFSAFPGRSAVDDDAFVLLRARPFIEGNPIKGVRVFLQPQYSRTFAQEESTVANGLNVDDLDLHQAYVDFTSIGGSRFSARLGRQELSYGDQRLIGAFGWSNTGRNFDAAKFSLHCDKGWVDLFGSWIQRAAGNQYVTGVYGHWDIKPSMQYEPFFLVLRDNDGGSGGGAMTVYTLGDRFTATFGAWDVGGEGAVQYGKSGGNTLLAYAGHLRGGYTFDVGWTPRLGFEYNMASGDAAPTTGRIQTFQNLFPTNHDKYGFMDLVGLRNMHDIVAAVSVKPSAKWTTGLNYHAFFLMQPADGLYQASGAQLRAGAAGASRFVGHEADLYAKFVWNTSVAFLGGVSSFMGGAFLSDTGTKRSAHFAYLQTAVQF